MSPASQRLFYAPYVTVPCFPVYVSSLWNSSHPTLIKAVERVYGTPGCLVRAVASRFPSVPGTLEPLTPFVLGFSRTVALNPWVTTPLAAAYQILILQFLTVAK